MTGSFAGETSRALLSEPALPPLTCSAMTMIALGCRSDRGRDSFEAGSEVFPNARVARGHGTDASTVPTSSTGRPSYRTYLPGSITRLGPGWARSFALETQPHSKGWPMERELTLDETVALLKDRNAKAREAITALTAEVAELRKENTRLKSAHDRAMFEIRRLEAIIAPIDTTQVTDAKKSAMWETVRTVHGFDVVSEDDENKNRARAYDYVVQRLEGAGIQVRAQGRSFGGGTSGSSSAGRRRRLSLRSPPLHGASSASRSSARSRTPSTSW